MLRRTPGLIVSIIFVLTCIGLYFFPYKPHFVLPKNTRYSYVSLIIVGIFFLIPLNIQLPYGDKQNKEIIPIQILFDVSLSMTATDLAPSRFAVAKDLVTTLVQSWKGYPVSIILFSGIPFVHVPFSTDTDAVLAKWQTTHLGQFPPVPQFVGTAIGDALLLGTQNMQNNTFASGVMILITDGDSNKGYEPDDVIGILQKKHIPLFALGIGKTDAFTVGYDAFNSQVLTTYNPEFLMHLTDTVDGQTFVAQTTQDVENIMISLKNEVQKRTSIVQYSIFFSLNDILIPLILVRIVYVTGMRVRIRYKHK